MTSACCAVERRQAANTSGAIRFSMYKIVLPGQFGGAAAARFAEISAGELRAHLPRKVVVRPPS
jgi:hypothetical protein